MSMMGIGGSGIPLPLPPNSFNNAPWLGTNEVILPAGQVYVVPSGTWMIGLGPYCFLQVLDPISQMWRMTGAAKTTPIFLNSDGNNYRVVNATGCPVGAVVTNAGTGYTSTPTVTASAGGSSWVAIVGGMISDTITITSGGTNYTYAPTVVISPPPTGGVQATAYCTISAGAVATVVVVDNGAGYRQAPTITFVSNPQDPNVGSLTAATATSALGTSTLVSAIYPTSFGTPQTSLITLTISGGGGVSAAATVVGCFSITGLTTGTAGAAVPGSAVELLGLGGVTTATPAAGVKNPSIGGKFFVPRPMVAYAPVSGGAVGTGVLIDSGLYQAAPTYVATLAAAAASAGLPTTAPVVTAAIGGVNDYFWMQPTL